MREKSQDPAVKISFSMPGTLEQRMHARMEYLEIAKVSDYIQKLIQSDIARGGPLVIRPPRAKTIDEGKSLRDNPSGSAARAGGTQPVGEEAAGEACAPLIPRLKEPMIPARSASTTDPSSESASSPDAEGKTPSGPHPKSTHGVRHMARREGPHG